MNEPKHEIKRRPLWIHKSTGVGVNYCAVSFKREERRKKKMKSFPARAAKNIFQDVRAENICIAFISIVQRRVCSRVSCAGCSLCAAGRCLTAHPPFSCHAGEYRYETAHYIPRFKCISVPACRRDINNIKGGPSRGSESGPEGLRAEIRQIQTSEP